MKGKQKNSDELREELFGRYPVLESCRASIIEAYNLLLALYKNGGKLLIAGNGGSAADSDHISGELTKSFLFDRVISPELYDNLVKMFGDDGKELSKHLEGGLPVVPLTVLTASNTAFSNDTDPKAAFAQLVNALGKKGDVFLGITTSGNSDNIIKALMVAKAKGMTAIALTGRTGGKCKGLADICICAPEDETFKIQELHLPIYHALCTMVEAELFEERK